jgi:hypothetical protein
VCGTYSGDIAIATSFVGGVAFDHLEEITGGLTANNVLGLTNISAVSLSSLNYLNVDLCPALTKLTVGAGQLTIPGYILIGGTGLAHLDGLGLSSNSQTGSIKISFNPNISADFSLDIQLAASVEIYRSESLANNSTFEPMTNSTWVRFPNLLSVTKDVFIHATDVLTDIEMPQLTYVLGQLIIAELLSLQSIELPELVKIGTSLDIYNNSALVSVALPKLQTVGLESDTNSSAVNALLIDNNSLWTGIDFPTLTSIGSSVDTNVTIMGNISLYVYT